MGQKKSLFPMVALVMLLIASQTVYSEDYTQVELTSGTTTHDPVVHYYTTKLQPFSISLTGNQKHTVYLIIPLDLEISDAYMNLSPETGNAPADVTITVGNASPYSSTGEFTGYECEKELADSMREYIEANAKREEYTISFPIVLTSENGGTIKFTAFSVGYRIKAVEELESALDLSTGMPKYSFWKAGTGPNPKYELQIRSREDFYSTSAEVLLKVQNISGAFYKLTEDNISTLKTAMEFGKTYSYGVKVIYDKVGESQWTVDQFTFKQEKPPPVTDINMTEGPNGIQFSWKGPENAKFDIVLNGRTYKEGWATTFCSLLYDGETMCLHGKNILTIWAVIDNEKSEPREHLFSIDIGTLSAPCNLTPNTKKAVRTKDFSFRWDEVPEASEYEIQLFDPSTDKVIKLPFGGFLKDTIRVSGEIYNPWIEEVNGEYPGIDLRPGESYSWQVRAIPLPGTKKPGTDEPMVESEWAKEIFIYQPVLLRMLVMFSAIGGVMGGFIRIAQEERTRAREKNRRMKIYIDYQTSIDLLVGLIIGVMFYLMVNQTLSQQLNPLNIPPLSYAGSVILGFIGGIISYDLTRLRRAIPE